MSEDYSIDDDTLVTDESMREVDEMNERDSFTMKRKTPMPTVGVMELDGTQVT